MNIPQDPTTDLVAVHLSELVHELIEETERLIRAGRMNALTGMGPAEITRFVQQLCATWLAEFDPSACPSGAS